MKKKKIILSYDYELFFGDKSGTVLKSLIEPTNQLLDAMDSVGFKGNFFIDWQMLKYLSLENDDCCKQDHAAIVNQLKDMVRRGHRIELHIHPHWVDAKYNGDGTWNFDEFRHYSLNSFSKDEITEMFVEGTNLLESITREVEPDYKIIAFRAGGWAVQPFDMLKEGFIKAGIKVDSSTMPGLEIICEHSHCDFYNMPVPENGYYRFEDDVLKPVSGGSFVEVPITSLERPFLSKGIGKLCKIFKKDMHSITDGSHTRTRDQDSVWNRKDNKSLCTLSGVHPLDNYLRLLSTSAPIICFIEHPKDFHPSAVRGILTISKIASSVSFKDYVNI